MDYISFFSISELLAGGGGLTFLILCILQIAPIEINPWSAIAKSIGNAMNADIKNEITSIKTDMNTMKNNLEQIKDQDDERYAVQCRIRILRFNDELLVNMAHTKDYFDQILHDVDEYEFYCDNHPEFKNNITIFAVDNIKKCYQKCLTEHEFL